jgi:O-antigen ligase
LLQSINNKIGLPKWMHLLAALVLVASIAVAAGTRHYYAIAAPFALLFAGWLIINWKSYFWFYIFTIAFTAIAQVGGSVMYLPFMPLSIVSAMLALALVIYNRNYIYENFARNPITLVMALQFFWLVISVVFSEIPFLSIKYLGVNIIQLLAFVILPCIVLKTKADWIKLLKILLITFTLVGTYVFVRHGLKSFTYLYTNVAVKPFFYNHVDHGCLMSMLVPLPYFIWRSTPKERKWLRAFYLALFVAFIIFTYLTFARAAMLAVIFSFVILFAIRKRLVHLLMTAFFICTISLTVYLIQNDNYKNYKPNFEQTYSRHTFDDLIKATFMGGDMSSMERFYRWIASARMSTERPFTGVGPNNFYYYYKPHAVNMFRTYVSRNEEKSTTHNYFIFMLVEQGWPAMVLYGVLIWVLFALAQKYYHQTVNIFYKRLALAAAMVIAAFFMNNLFSELLQTYKIGAVFYLAVVALIWVDRQLKSEAKRQYLA